MADILLPPWLNIARLHTDYLDNTGMTRGLYTAAPETTGFGGDRLKLSLEFVPTSSRQTPVERAALRTFLARLRGRQNRAYLYDPSYRQRGSFPAPELLGNNTFANGTTGLSAFNSSSNLTVVDRRLRATFNNAALGMAITNTSALTTLTQYAPYAFRVMAEAGRGDASLTLMRAGTTQGGTEFASSTPSGVGLQTVVAVPYSVASVFVTAGVGADAGRIAGDYWTCPYISLSRCALVDNGPNLLLQSDEFDATWTPNNATVDDQTGAAVAPDGTATADALEENTTNGFHYVQQSKVVSAAAADYAFGVAIRAGSRAFAFLEISGGSGSATVYVNINGVAVGAPSNGTGWANARAFVVNAGNGWVIAWIVARKTNSDTSITARVGSATALGSGSYVGINGDDAIYLWRGTLAQSSVPPRLALTTVAATTGATQTGSALYIKGLPASTNDLLLPDDRFEVITSRGSELKIVTAALNSDAAGLGYLQFEPPLLGVPADNAPIIINQPMTRAIFAGDVVGWDDAPGMLTTASAEFEEAA